MIDPLHKQSARTIITRKTKPKDFRQKLNLSFYQGNVQLGRTAPPIAGVWAGLSVATSDFLAKVSGSFQWNLFEQAQNL